MHQLNVTALVDCSDATPEASPRHVALSNPRSRLKALLDSPWPPSAKWKRKFEDLHVMIQSHHEQLAQSIRASGRRDVGYYQRETSSLRHVDDPYTHMKLYWYARIHRWFGTETCQLWYARQRFIRQWARVDKAAGIFRSKLQDTGGTIAMPCFYGQEAYWKEVLKDGEMKQLFVMTWSKVNGPLVALDKDEGDVASRLFRCLYNLEAGVIAHFPYHVIFHLACVCDEFKYILHEYHDDLSMHRQPFNLIAVSPRELDPHTDHCKM